MNVLPTPNVEKLKALSFFNLISQDELAQIKPFIQNRLYQKDETIISEKEIGDSIFILLEGRINIVKEVDGGQLEVVNTIETPGSLFGEMSVIQDKPRSAGAVAAEDSQLLFIEKDQFLTLVKQFPDLSMQIAISIADFLRNTDSKFIGILKQKNAEIESAYYKLKAAQEELVRKERLSAIGKLASSIMHDIRNPLTIIRGYAELIKDPSFPPEKSTLFAKNILNEVDRFLAMTQELLTFATGKDGLNRENVKLKEFLEELVNSIENQFIDRGHSIRLQVTYPGFVNIDPNRFRRALENICYNALEAMKDKGRFSISASATDFGVKIELEDTGCGMSETVKDHIFDEFFSHEKSHGTGLGLSIAQKIIEEHKGSIKVESQVGLGTKFTILFPIEL